MNTKHCLEYRRVGYLGESCNRCGYPFGSGSDAYWHVIDKRWFCSKFCASKDRITLEQAINYRTAILRKIDKDKTPRELWGLMQKVMSNPILSDEQERKVDIFMACLEEDFVLIHKMFRNKTEKDSIRIL